VSAEPIRVFLLDDHDVVREGLRFLLERHDDIEVVGRSPISARCSSSIPVVTNSTRVPSLPMTPRAP
jgi:hypothetical protein